MYVEREPRARIIEATRKAYRNADLAMDKFAANKDEEAFYLIAIAKESLENALRILNANKKPIMSEKLAELLRSSPFATVVEAERFTGFYQRSKHHSAWDDRKMEIAKQIIDLNKKEDVPR